MPPQTSYLALLLLLLAQGRYTRHQRLCDNYFLNDLSNIQTKVSCEISNSVNGTADINVSWTLTPELTAYNIIASNYFRSFGVFCNCSFSGNFTKGASDFNSKSYSKHLTQFKNISIPCYDECSCSVYYKAYCSIPNSWSHPSTCYNGPAAPVAPPVIISPPLRNYSIDKNSVQVKFKLPPMSQYCDHSITNITVNITQNKNVIQQYSTDNQLNTLQNDSGYYIFKFKFPVELLQFWSSFDIAVSVQNSVGSTPFSKYMTVRKDDLNITSRYTFQSHFDCELSILYLYWNLSPKAKNMLNNHFITGFQVTLQQLGDDNNNITTLHMNSTNLTLSISVKPNEYYLLIGRILLVDNMIYRTEPSYSYFKVSPVVDEEPSSLSDNHDDEQLSSNDDHNYFIMLILISGFLAIVIVLLSVYIKICYKQLSQNRRYHDNDNGSGDNDNADTGDDDDDDDDDDDSYPYSTKHDDRKFDKVLAIATDLSNSFPTNLFSYNNPFVSKFSSSNVKVQSIVGDSYIEQMDEPSVVENS